MWHSHGDSVLRSGYGRGRRRRLGVKGSTGVACLRAPPRGSEVTTSGSSRLFSACSIAADNSRDESASMGDEKTRLASFPQTAQIIESGAVPSGHAASNTPCCSQQCSYSAMPPQSRSYAKNLPKSPPRTLYRDVVVVDITCRGMIQGITSSAKGRSRSGPPRELPVSPQGCHWRQ